MDEGTALVVEADFLHVIGDARVTVYINSAGHPRSVTYGLNPGEDADLSRLPKFGMANKQGWALRGVGFSLPWAKLL